MFLEHELIKPSSIELRDYQANIARAALEEPTLVVLPTGMGKTVVALFLTAETLSRKKGAVLFMAPTKPLVEQHSKFLRDHLIGFEPLVFTGEIPPERRREGWAEGRLVISTPQVAANDIGSGMVDLSRFDLVVFDEAHRAVGDYAYVFIGKALFGRNCLILGLTASPGSNVSKIANVCENLGITWVEIRSELDDDVVDYTQDVKMEFVEVPMQRGMARIVAFLKQIFDEQVVKLRAAGFLDPKKPITTRDLLAAGATIRSQLNSGKKTYSLFSIASAQALAMKVNHGIELAETQGRGALENYFEKQINLAEENKRSKAVRTLIKDARFQQARAELYKMTEDHPKLDKLIPILDSQFKTKPDSRAIVFTHYRDTCDLITNRLGTVEGLRPVRFVGQASKGEDVGLKQKEQREVIERFQSGGYNVLVATSIAEEGLDIPATDLVVFYEPVPSEIRTIQRRGRTGRRQSGRVVILMTKGTKDEAYFWSSRNKELQMKRQLESLRKKLRTRKGLSEIPSHRNTLEKGEISGLMVPDELTDKERRSRKTADVAGQKSLSEYDVNQKNIGSELMISHRLDGSPLHRSLIEAGLPVRSAALECADIVLSGRVGITLRTVEQFISEMSEEGLLSLLAKMKHRFLHPILIVQGPPEGKGTEASNATVYDALGLLLSDFGRTVFSTADTAETIAAVRALHKQETERFGGAGALQTTPDNEERQLFLIQGLPNVSATLAQRLLEHFGSLEKIADASPQQLLEVNGVGRVIAQSIHTVMRNTFEEEDVPHAR
ncbi:MAG: DEAD/DEAH box helicase family protein [Methanobacteriota archaeon]|nr:MAG: DEAD/DEAH box helicase family protein [Euryarchaeota archaeon]